MKCFKKYINVSAWKIYTYMPPPDSLVDASNIILYVYGEPTELQLPDPRAHFNVRHY